MPRRQARWCNCNDRGAMDAAETADVGPWRDPAPGLGLMWPGGEMVTTGPQN